VGRASAIGVYRFWRDMGYVAGGLLAGLLADAIDFGGAIAAIAVLTAISGLWVMADMPGRPGVARHLRSEGGGTGSRPSSETTARMPGR
jgi:predicted MFS family arabinose efflux permease